MDKELLALIVICAVLVGGGLFVDSRDAPAPGTTTVRTSSPGVADDGFEPLALHDNDKPFDPVENPFVHIEGYESHLGRFTFARSAEEVEQIKRKIDDEQARREAATAFARAWGPTAAAVVVGGVAASLLGWAGWRFYRPATVATIRGATAGASGVKRHIKGLVEEARQSDRDE